MHYRIMSVASTETSAQFMVMLVNKYPTHTETIKSLTFSVDIDHRLVDNEPNEICLAKLKEFGYDVEGVG